MSNKNIILLEDYDELRELYKSWLGRAGYHVVAQHNGKNVKQLVADQRPALLITDIVMPDHEGMACIFEMIARYTIPIMVISGYEKYLDLIRPLVEQCLQKPFSEQQLAGEVNRILGHREIARVI